LVADASACTPLFAPALPRFRAVREGVYMLDELKLTGGEEAGGGGGRVEKSGQFKKTKRKRIARSGRRRAQARCNYTICAAALRCSEENVATRAGASTRVVFTCTTENPNI
jgi:hypothetical protein